MNLKSSDPADFSKLILLRNFKTGLSFCLISSPKIIINDKNINYIKFRNFRIL